MDSKNFVDEFNIASNYDESINVTDYERFEKNLSYSRTMFGTFL